MRNATVRNPRQVVVYGRRTSIRLEPLLWDALREIAGRRGMALPELATEIAEHRTIGNLTAAIRVYIVDFYRTEVLGYLPASTGARSTSPS